MFRFTKTSKTSPKPESPAAMLKRVEAEAEAERIQMKLDDEKRERAEKIRAERLAALSAETVTAKTESAIKREMIVDKMINFGPLFLISGLAIIGQFGYFGDALRETFPAEVFAKIIGGASALALELIALFLGLHAMRALRRGDSAAGLLLAATGVAGLVAWMNFEHFRNDDGVPTLASYAFALFSFAAPFLWRIKIRGDHRDTLVANGEIEKRGLKLPRVMWFMHPIKSYRVYRLAAWTGTRDIELAVKEWESADQSGNTEIIETVPEIDAAHMLAMIENLRRDLQIATGRTDDADDESKPLDVPRQRPALNAGSTGYPTHHPKWNEGVALYEASLDGGRPMLQADLATELGMKNRVLASQIMQFVKAQRAERKADRDRLDGADLATETA